VIQISTLLIKKIVISRILSLCSRLPLLRDLPAMFIDPEGFRYYAEIQDWWRFTKPFEPLTYDFLTKNAREDDVFLDVGHM